MEKIKNIVYKVNTLLYKRLQTNNKIFSNEFIYSVARDNRNKLVLQTISKKRKVNNIYYTTIDCIKLLPVEGCGLYRSQYRIPSTLSDFNYADVEVMSLSGNIRFSPTTVEDLKYIEGNKYTSKGKFYYFEDGYLFTSDGIPDEVKVRGLFSSEAEVQDLISECEETKTCKDYNELEFKIESNAIDTVVKLTLESLLNTISNGNNKEKEETSREEG